MIWRASVKKYSVYVHFLGDVLAHIPTTFGYSFPTCHMQTTSFNGRVLVRIYLKFWTVKVPVHVHL